MTEEELQQRQQAAEARIAAAAKRRAEKLATREQAEEVERLEREATEAETLEALETEHGEIDKAIKAIHTPWGMIVVKKAPYLTVKKYLDAGKATVESQDKLGRPCVIYPPRAEYAKVAAEHTAVIVRVADAVCWLDGWGRTELAGKSET